MDFKFRLQQNQKNNRNTTGGVPKNNINSENPNTAGWDRYARKTSPIPINPSPYTTAATKPEPSRQTENEPRNIKSSVTQNTRVDRYYRSDVAPKNQFKHYLSDGNNVFFEERQSIRLIKTYEQIKWITGIIWVIMLLFFILLYFIKPFTGDCPSNAQCGVFVHCPSGFTYHRQTNQCILSEQLYAQIQVVCVDMIEKAKMDWANQQCNQQQTEKIPQISLEDILSGITDRSLKLKLTDKLEVFLQNPQDQHQHGFQYFPRQRVIIPTQKKYSLVCRTKLFARTHNFKIGFPIVLLALILATMLIVSLRRKIVAKNIYKQLKRRTSLQKQKLLNISYAKPDLQKQYGVIDEKMWELVDQYRSKDQEIGFLQDDFLYWKML